MGRKLQPGTDDIKEEWVKKQIKLRLDSIKNDIHHFMPPAGMYGRSGIHDHLIVQRGFFWSIEAKADKKPPTDNQIVFANRVNRAGGISLLVNEFNLDDVTRVVCYIDVFKRLPYFLAHDFNKYSK